MTLPRFALVIILPVLLMLTSCGTSTSDESSTTASTYASYFRLTPFSPPDTPYEEPIRPGDPMKEIWRPGYWKYDGAKFTWEPGYLMQRPSSTATWSPDHWEKREYGFAFVEGYWQ